jgi:hypothetical protein
MVVDDDRWQGSWNDPQFDHSFNGPGSTPAPDEGAVDRSISPDVRGQIIELVRAAPRLRPERIRRKLKLSAGTPMPSLATIKWVVEQWSAGH